MNFIWLFVWLLSLLLPVYPEGNEYPCQELVLGGGLYLTIVHADTGLAWVVDDAGCVV